MEIIKAGENTSPDSSNKARHDKVRAGENGELKITKITPAVKTPGRYNIFVNAKYAFSLDEIQLVNLGLRRGRVMTEAELAEFKDESAFGKAYVRAVDLISRRRRSEKEIRDYAFRKKWSPEIRDRVIARLYDKKYLDDERFAESFVRAKAATANYSRRQLELKLREKGISRDIIARVVDGSDDYDEAAALEKMILKKRGHYETDEKLIKYLMRQGFRYDAIKKSIDNLT
jgi:regulatory protein